MMVGLTRAGKAEWADAPRPASLRAGEEGSNG